MLRASAGFMMAFGLAGPALAAQVARDTFGCTALATADQLTSLRSTADAAAYADNLGRLARAGQCRAWGAGERVIVKDREDSLVCLSPQATSSTCYWTTSADVE